MSDVRPETLVMFSGGKDSFLAAIREIAAGRRVVLVSFDSGHLVAHAYLRLCADRLSRRYGAERAEYLGCYNTTPTVSVLTQYWTHSTQAAVTAANAACLTARVGPEPWLRNASAYALGMTAGFALLLVAERVTRHGR